MRSLLCILLLVACKEGGVADDEVDASSLPDPDGGGTDYPPPRADLVPGIGTADAIDIATWNIENFPRTADTPRVMADLITSLGLDLVAVQEIASVEAFDELVARLPEHEGLLSSHQYGDGNYQKVGFIYRADLMQLEGGALLFDDQGFDFPRPPLQVAVTAGDVTFLAISMHLKAGIGDADRDRRRAAMITLEAHVREVVEAGSEDEVIILGDYNERVDTEEGREVFAPFLDAPGDYALRTLEPAENGVVTYLPFGGRFIDHVITTSGLAGEMSAADPIVPPLHEQLGSYDSISDHLPAVASMPIL